MKKVLYITVAIAAMALLFTAGHVSGRLQRLNGRHFGGLLIIPVSDYLRLVDPTHPKISAQAARFGTFEEAYRFVRDEIRYDPSCPPSPPDKVILEKTAGCLGKVALLCSLYRAMGMPSDRVRVVVGELVHDDSPVEHAWLDLEIQDAFYQQDPSGLIGRFEFHSFPNGRFTKTFARRELFCFNDRDFAMVSQLNRLRYLEDGPVVGP